MTQQFDIEAASIETLKAMSYDQMVVLQQAQNNLTALAKAIEYKQSQATESKEQTNDDTCNDTSAQTAS